MNSNPDAETVGLAPKVGWITLAAIALGVVIAIVDKLFLDDEIPDEAWLVLFVFAPVAIGVGHQAPAALQKTKTPRA